MGMAPADRMTTARMKANPATTKAATETEIVFREKCDDLRSPPALVAIATVAAMIPITMR